MKSLFWFAFCVPPRDDDHTQFWHQQRDADGFLFLHTAFCRVHSQARFAGILRNVPGCPPPGRFGPDDVLVATTRLPLDDDDDDRRTVVRGGSALERELGVPRVNAVNSAPCRLFLHLNRSYAILQPALAAWLPTGMKNRFDIQFSNLRGARCISYDRKATSQDYRRTAAYLVSIPHAWPGGPALVWSFGLSGETGLIWNKIVSEELAADLAAPCFVMAEFDIPERLTQPRSRDAGPGTFDDFTARSLNMTYLIRERLTDARLQSLGLPTSSR